MSRRRGVSPGGARPRGVGRTYRAYAASCLCRARPLRVAFASVATCLYHTEPRAVEACSAAVCGRLRSLACTSRRARRCCRNVRRRARHRVRAGVAWAFHGGAVRAVDAGQADGREVGEEFEEGFDGEGGQAA